MELLDTSKKGKKTKESSTKDVAKKTKGSEPKVKRESASAMFQELIMAGKMTDDEIFAAVQEKFGLPDKKRNYVPWYRNYLKKAGMNPPEPKGGAAKKPDDSAPAKKAPAKKTAAPVEEPETKTPLAAKAKKTSSKAPEGEKKTGTKKK